MSDKTKSTCKDTESHHVHLCTLSEEGRKEMVDCLSQRAEYKCGNCGVKANFPTRISFKVSSKVDSRTIIDTSGAEHLLGAGDMLYLAPGSSALKRIHGAYISEAETARLIEFWKKQGAALYDESVMEEVEGNGEVNGDGGEDDYDDRYDEAVAAVCEAGGASISMIQRRLRIGYNRAARMIEKMEREGIVGPADGSKPREVLVRNSYE